MKISAFSAYVLALALAAPGAAADTPKKTYNVPLGEAASTLKQFTEQSGEQVVYLVDTVRGVATNAVAGDYTAREALDAMLAGTRLEVVQDEKTGALTVRRNAADASQGGAGAQESGLAALSSALPIAPAAPEAAIHLPEFGVSATKADPYRQADVMSVARIGGSILDSPMSVNVVTPQLINDIGANAAFDVTRYFSGISPGRGTGGGGIMDRQDFRGFESFSKTIDDFSSFLIPTGQGFQANFDPAFIDRAELVMGPDSILSPTGTPGGSVNVITKSPKFEAGTDVAVEVGNYNASKVTLDSTGPIGDGRRLAYRIIASYQDGQTYVPGTIRNSNASVQLAYRFSEKSKLTVKYIGEQWGLTGAIADANANGEMISSPGTVAGATLSPTPQPGFVYRGWNGDTTWSNRHDRVNIGEAEFTTALGSQVSMRLGAEILYDAFTQDAGYPSTNPAERWDPNSGQEISVTALDPTALAEIASFNHAMNREIQIQNDYAANFKVGRVSVQPVAGWAYQQGSEPVVYQIQDKSAADMPPANLSLGYYSPPHPPMANYTAFSANDPEHAWLYQAYGLVKTGFFEDRVFVTTGAARTWADVNIYSYRGIYLPMTGQIGAATPPTDLTFAGTGVAAAPTQADRHDTYLTGLVAKPLPNVSIYYSLSTNAGIAQNSPVWQAGRQHEFGVKSEFFDQRLSLSAAHFQITEDNVSSVNPLFNTGQSTIANILANETNRGFELNAVGGITKELSVIASYTNMRLRDAARRRVRNVPDNMANLLLNYHVHSGPLKNMNAFVGVIHVGNVAGENSPNLGYTPSGVPDQVGFYVAAWTVANAGAGYEWGRYRFNLNVDNLLDQHFWWQPASRQSVSPYPGITFRFRSSVHF